MNFSVEVAGPRRGIRTRPRVVAGRLASRPACIAVRPDDLVCRVRQLLGHGATTGRVVLAALRGFLTETGVRKPALEPARQVSGTSGGKCPTRCISVHIPAYLPSGSRLPGFAKPPQMGIIRGRGSLVTLAIAMQKVEGSNPFSRFFANALHVGGLGSAREPRINWNHPRISSPFEARVPQRAAMRSD